MKNIYRIAAILFVLAFLAGVAFLVNDLISLQDKLAKVLDLKDLAQRQKMEPVLWQLTLHVALTIAAALLAIFFLVLNASRAKIVIAQQLEEEIQRSKQEKEAVLEDAATAMRREIEEKVARIREIVNAKAGTDEFFTQALAAIAEAVEASQGILYLSKYYDGVQYLEVEAGYAYYASEGLPQAFEVGEGFIGQAVKDKKTLVFNELPEGYISVPVVSGLGKGAPRSLLIAPMLDADKRILGAIELASFKNFTEKDKLLVEEAMMLLAPHVFLPATTSDDKE
ncbi:GAF domain-containing protein [Thermonema rossianum]|uniref:GAF domain-containing protein n=1 Tax=Thermonema rossianum TaxID=55505 RepID=UPI000572094F|nr:GAF domain-containing protein [Thermonema rossianum]